MSHPGLIKLKEAELKGPLNDIKAARQQLSALMDEVCILRKGMEKESFLKLDVDL